MIPVYIHTCQTGRLGRVDSDALSSRVIFPSARRPNITHYCSPRAAESTVWWREWGNAHVMKRVKKRGRSLERWGVLSQRVSLDKTPFRVSARAQIREWCRLWGQLLTVIHRGCSHVDSHLFLLWTTATSCFFFLFLFLSPCAFLCLSLCAEINPADTTGYKAIGLIICTSTSEHTRSPK